MARIRVRTLVAAPPAAVWRVLEDVEGHVDWMEDAVAIRFLPGPRSGVGTRFECDTRVGPLRTTDVMEVTEWVPRRAMGVTHTGTVTGRGRFTLRKARGGRTELTWRERLHFPWWLGGPVTALAARPVLKRLWRRNLDALAALAERG